MEETTDDTRLVERPVHSGQWWQSGRIDKLRKISLASPNETSSSKAKGQLDCGSPAFHFPLYLLTISPEHPLFRGHGQSLLGDCSHSFREYDNDINASSSRSNSRSVGASPIESRRRRRRCISMVAEIGDDIMQFCTWSPKFEFRAVREMSETLKRNRHPEEQVSSSYSCSASEQEDCSDLLGSVSRLNPDAHDGLYGQKPSTYKLPLNLKQLHSHKAVSMPSSPQRFSRKASLMSDTSENFANPDMISTFNKVLESSKFLNEPLLPFEEWNIDFSEITVGARVGIGFFGEVFRGTWNGLEVAI